MFIQTLITDYYSYIGWETKNLTQTKITNYFNKKRKKVYGYNSDTMSWHCIECGKDMGFMNPRQLCNKTYCGNSLFF